MQFMRMCLVVLLVGSVACGGKTKSSPASTPENTAVATQPAAKPSGFRIEVVDGTPDGPSVEGTIRDAVAKEPLAGATVIVRSPSLEGEQAIITDDNGHFALEKLPPGTYTMTVYYADARTETTLQVTTGKLAKVELDWTVSGIPAEDIVTITPQVVVYKTATEALDHGAVDQAYEHLAKDLAKKPSAKLHGMLAIARYGMAVDLFHGILRTYQLASDVKQVRTLFATFVSDLDKVQYHLAEAAKDPQFVLEMCVACITAEGGMGLPPGALDIERDRAGQQLPEDDKRRRPVVRFDHGDIAWARAMVSFQQALGNVMLAYDWDWVQKVGDDEPAPGSALTIKLVEPARIAKARELVLAALQFSDASREEYLKETDDDREWVPSPKQKNYASPLAVDAKLYQTWAEIVGDVRSLVESKSGLALPGVWKLFGGTKGAPTGFLDLGAMFTTPKDIVIEIGALDRIEVERNPKVASQMTTTVIKKLVGAGYKATMKPSKITDRLLQLRTDFAKDDAVFADKLKYVLWIN